MLVRAGFEASLAMAGARQGVRRFRDAVIAARLPAASTVEDSATLADAIEVQQEGT